MPIPQQTTTRAGRSGVGEQKRMTSKSACAARRAPSRKWAGGRRKEENGDGMTTVTYPSSGDDNDLRRLPRYNKRTSVGPLTAAAKAAIIDIANDKTRAAHPLHICREEKYLTFLSVNGQRPRREESSSLPPAASAHIGTPPQLINNVIYWRYRPLPYLLPTAPPSTCPPPPPLPYLQASGTVSIWRPPRATLRRKADDVVD